MTLRHCLVVPAPLLASASGRTEPVAYMIPAPGVARRSCRAARLALLPLAARVSAQEA